MKPASGHKNWLSLLLRWLAGDAGRKDERALEALAKDDPFLGDAFDGYRSLPAENHVAAVTRLKADLRSKYKKRQRGAGFFVLRAAAAGAVLVAAWLILQQFNQEENAQAGISEAIENPIQQAPPTSISPANPQGPATTETEATGTSHLADEPQALNKDYPPDQETAERKSATNPAPPPVRLQEPALERSAPLETFKQEEFSLQEEKLADAAREPEAGTAKTSPPAALKKTDLAMKPAADGATGFITNDLVITRRISGTVTDESGSPLIGATVSVDNYNLGTVTNVDGSYFIDLPHGAESLVFSYTGYGTMYVEIGEEDSINVQMVASASVLEEVAVTGFKQGKRSEASAPQPIGGFKKFEKYLGKELRFPEAASKAGIEGEVVTSFRIGEDGSPYDFRIIKSLGHGCDEEAIRLLREGPKWKAQAGTTATYSIFFKQK